MEIAIDLGFLTGVRLSTHYFLGGGKVSNFFNRIKRGVKAAKESFGPTSYRAAGIQVVCPHCRNDVFEKGEAQLNTAAATFLNLDWLNKSATVLICTGCGYIQWFGKSLEKIERD